VLLLWHVAHSGSSGQGQELWDFMRKTDKCTCNYAHYIVQCSLFTVGRLPTVNLPNQYNRRFLLPKSTTV
jgi:hypothetical protein